tara:strand:- start:220 stop:417 length:198 start_codon:yes stop_codon:yes gene_type:complete
MLDALSKGSLKGKYRLIKNAVNNFHVEIGGSQTRTGGDRSRWIYSPLQLPLCDTPKEEKYAGERN